MILSKQKLMESLLELASAAALLFTALLPCERFPNEQARDVAALTGPACTAGTPTAHRLRRAEAAAAQPSQTPGRLLPAPCTHTSPLQSPSMLPILTHS